MSREAIYGDPAFPDPQVRVSVDRGLVGDTIQKAADAKEEYENLPSDAGFVERFLAKGKMQFLAKIENAMKNSNETEARVLEAEREYLLDHIDDALQMLNTLEVKKMGMKARHRRIVEDV